ncbi:MAG: alpha/beta hydrolase, partial [Balneolaceae bacterium]
MKLFIKVLTTLIISVIAGATSMKAQNVTGDWYGTMNVQSMQLKIVFHIEQTEDGYSATFDSPVERAFGIPLTNVSVQENQILLEVESIRLQFEGTLDNDQIIGKWKQSGAEFDLVLTKEKIEIAGPNRPQEPSRPLPYREEEVRFTNSVDEITL